MKNILTDISNIKGIWGYVMRKEKWASPLVLIPFVILVYNVHVRCLFPMLHQRKIGKNNYVGKHNFIFHAS